MDAAVPIIDCHCCKQFNSSSSKCGLRWCDEAVCLLSHWYNLCVIAAGIQRISRPTVGALRHPESQLDKIEHCKTVGCCGTFSRFVLEYSHHLYIVANRLWAEDSGNIDKVILIVYWAFFVVFADNKPLKAFCFGLSVYPCVIIYSKFVDTISY